MKIEHIAIYTRNLDAMRDFYQSYFGASSNDRYQSNSGMQSYFLTFDAGARLELMWLPSLQDGAAGAGLTGFTHLAFSVGSREAVDSLTDRLVQGGHRLVSAPRTTGDGYYESCIADPDGNAIEIAI